MELPVERPAWNRAGVLYALAASLLAAGFYVPYKAAAIAAPRGAIVCALLLCAAVFNTAVAVIQRRPVVGKTTWVAAVVLAVFTIFGNVGMASALAVQKAAVTSVFLQTQVLIVAALGWMFLRERVGMPFAVGALLALAGFVGMNLPALQGTGTSVRMSGVLWALVAATSFAIMQVYTRGVIDRIDTVVVNAARLWLAVAVLVAIPGNARALAELNSKIWLLCAAAAFLGPFLSRLALMEAVRHISAARAALVIMVNPVFAGVFGFAAFRSIPTALEIGGATLILAGVSAPLLPRLFRGER